MQISKRWALGIALAASQCIGGLAWSANRLVISTSVVAPYTTPEHTGFLDQLLAAVFLELGMDVEILVYPAASERSLLNANEGIDDGQALRVAGLEHLYPNLIQVPEPVIMNDFVALSMRHRFATPGWGALKPYTVSYIIGWKIFEANVPPGTLRTTVREAEQLFTLLARDRVDVVLYERWQGLAQARRSGLRVQAMEPPLLSTPMYMYLHKKHAALVPRVAQALARLKRNGVYQRIQADTLRP